ncbi:MAG: lipopolysaccharide biosynthesis protein [Elusimicrobia bacterium]|nr:lipopolysaccharide biosynthesis protein [Elusimicrobiota bacterium]
MSAAHKDSDGRFTRFAAGVRFNVYGQALQAALPFLTTPLIVGGLGPEPYSLLAMVSSLVSQLNLLGFGAAPAAVKYLAELDPERDRARVDKVFGNTFLFYALTGLAGTLLLLSVAPLLSSRTLHLTPGMQIVAGFLFSCGAAAFLLQSLTATFQSVPRALQRFDVVNAGETAASILSQLGACALLTMGFWVRALALWQALIAAAGLAFFVIASRRLLPNARLVPSHDPEVMGRIVRFGGPVFLAQVSWSVLNQLDKVVLGFYVPMDQLVHYFIPFNLAQKLVLVLGPVLAVLLPLSSQLSSSEDLPNARKLMLSGTKISFLLLAPLVILGSCFGPAFLELWLGGNYSEHGGWILRWLILGNFAACLCGFSSFIAQGFGRYKVPAVLAAVLTAAAALSWPVFLPRYGLIAAAGAYCAVQTLNAAGLLWWVSRRLLHLPPGSLVRALSWPLACTVPLFIPAVLLRNTLRSWPELIGFGAAAGLYWAWAAWSWGLDDAERGRLRQAARPVLGGLA